MTPIDRLAQLKLTLPEASTPGGSYTSVNVRGATAFVAIQFPIWNGDFLFRGRLGALINTDAGYEAMQLCALNVLAQIHEKVGFEHIVGVNHLDAYYCAVDGWDAAPKVVNGASDLFVNALQDRGQHTRGIFGVAQLPRGFCVGLTTSFTVREQQKEDTFTR